LKVKILNLLNHLMLRARRERGMKKYSRARNRLLQQLNHFGCFEFNCKCSRKQRLKEEAKAQQKYRWKKYSHILSLNHIANVLLPEESVILNNFIASDHAKAKRNVFSTNSRKKLNMKMLSIEIEQDEERARLAKMKLKEWVELLIELELNTPEAKQGHSELLQQIPSYLHQGSHHT
jgi:hypothetical protein